MTDDPDFLDELLSRYLDGDATDDEVARIEADPALLARADDLRAAIELVGQPLPIPTGELDRIRAAALAQSATSTAVSDLDTRRAEKLQNRNRFLAAAAVFVFLAVGYAAVQSTGDGDGDDDTASDTATTDDAADAGLARSGGDDAADDSDDSGDMMAEAEMADADMAADEAGIEEAEGDADDMASDGDMGDDGSDDTAEELRPFDVLPDDLGVVANLTELEAKLDDLRSIAESEARFAEPTPDPADGLCDGLLAYLAEALPAGVLAVELAPVVVSGLTQQVALATGFDGTLIAVLIADDACEVLEPLEIDGG